MFSIARFIANNSPVYCDVIKSDKYVATHKMPDTEFCDMTGGMKYRDIKLGDGVEVQRGHLVNVQYTGRLLGGREIETTNHRSGGAVVVTAGGNEGVKAISEGIIGMKEYGSRELLVPPSMHYPDRFPKQIMVYEVLVRTIVR